MRNRHTQHTGLEKPACKVCGTRSFTATGMRPDMGGRFLFCFVFLGFFFLLGRNGGEKKRLQRQQTQSHVIAHCPRRQHYRKQLQVNSQR